MASLILTGNTSGSIELQAPANAGTTVLTLPAVSGVLITVEDAAQAYVFDTVALMNASLTIFPIGKTLITKGYYAAGDGGGASYLIKPSGTAKGGGDHTLADGKVAVLQNTHINSTMYGAFTGTPEANGVLGRVGFLFSRTDGGTGTTLYVKESGDNTDTGWIAK